MKGKDVAPALMFLARIATYSRSKQLLYEISLDEGVSIRVHSYNWTL